MFNNLIRRYFDGTLDAPSRPIQVLSPCIRDSLHCILVELLHVANGSPTSDYSVAIGKFKCFFQEAQKFLGKRLEDSFSLKSLSFEEESGFRISCLIKLISKDYTDDASDSYFIKKGILPIVIGWLKDPESFYNKAAVSKTFLLFIDFNKKLNDEVVVSLYE